MNDAYERPDPGAVSAGEAMRAGVIACSPETSLRRVAQMMAGEHIHCVVVIDEGRWGVVTDLMLLASAGADLETTTAGDVATSDLPTAETGDPLERALKLMVERRVSHLLVTEPGSERAAGVLSTLDVARFLAGGG